MVIASRRRVLVVGAGPFQCDVIRTVARAGHMVAAVDGAADAPGLGLAELARVCDLRDTREVVRFARAERIDAVLTAASDVALPAVAAVAEALGLPGLRSEALARGRDKLLTYHTLVDAGLPAPFTAVAPKTEIEIDALLNDRRLGNAPWVIKPRCSAGGRGVSFVRERSELARAIAHAEACSSDASGALVQAFVPGTSVGIEACFFAGALVRAFALSDQYVAGFVSPVGHALPCALAPAELALVHHTVSAWGRALGVASGVINFDARLDGPTLVMLEANLRPGGSSISELLRVSLGVDVSLSALRCALGEHPREALTPFGAPRAAASRLVLLPGSGRVSAQRALPAFDVGDVVLAERLATGSVPAEVNGFGLYGRCLVRGQSPEDAAARAERVASELAASLVVEGAS